MVTTPAELAEAARQGHTYLSGIDGNFHDEKCCAACAALAELERQAEEAEGWLAENDTMRGIIANSPSIPCVYCGVETMARCPRGFPGCAQADDLLVSGDDHMRRSLEALRARVQQLEEALREILGHDDHTSDPQICRHLMLESARAVLVVPSPPDSKEGK